MTSTHRHVPFVQLVELAEGRLSDDEQQRLRAHLSGCGRCTAELAWLEQLIDLMRTDELAWLEQQVDLMRTDESVDPPPEVIARAVALFHSRKMPNQSILRERLRAVLRFDSTRPSLAPAPRSGILAERQLLFEADRFNVDLRIRPYGSMWLVFGQVFGATGGGQVHLNGPTGATRTDLNDLSEFRLPAVPAGSYYLILRLEHIDVEIAGLEIGV